MNTEKCTCIENCVHNLKEENEGEIHVGEKGEKEMGGRDTCID